MNASERNLLVEADPMSESMLVKLDDWKLAHLRVAMLHQVEQTLSETLHEDDDADRESPLDRIWASHCRESHR